MKKLFFLWVGLIGLCSAVVAQPNFNLFSQTKTLVLLQPTNLAGGTVYSGPVDMSGYGGVISVIITAISNGVAGDATITLYNADSPTNAAALWVPISNACVSAWSVLNYTNLAMVGGAGITTNVVNFPGTTEAYTGKASVTTSSNTTYVIGVPVRDTKPFWVIGVTNAGSSLRALSAVAIGRYMTGN